MFSTLKRLVVSLVMIIFLIVVLIGCDGIDGGDLIGDNDFIP